MVEKAKANPIVENGVKRLHLNMRTEQEVRVISMTAWDKLCAEQYGPNDLRGMKCYGGLDLASREDLASAALVFPFPNDVYKILSFSWCPEEKVTKRTNKGTPYDVWARQGLVDKTAGNRIDHRV